jgi:hypothetical protein
MEQLLCTEHCAQPFTYFSFFNLHSSERMYYYYSHIIYLFLMVLGIELRASHLLDRHSAA